MPEQGDCCGWALERKKNSVGLLEQVEVGERESERAEEQAAGGGEAAGGKGTGIEAGAAGAEETGIKAGAEGTRETGIEAGGTGVASS